LLNPIVQVLDLAYLDLLTGFLLEYLDGCGIGSALVDRDLVRLTVSPNYSLEKSAGRSSCRDG
jgi:hypothetical protein